ncbi:uncharacterized protein (DUF2336 family) [Bradyrhizobium sp. GM2.2]|jgi:uncharacterized protein (DUF2336 family)|uniref:DUF2336 domain-containing protein n=1 Tax=Bradyrhizobium TaxID=374 RepID=UPI0003A44A36|nr:MULTISPECIES: DUF2336 domain-containing protein [Bradyrhizobium]MBM7481362.1 uncharacterized protein (DUF2336 family) [Bradyrhizobium canariense]MCK1272463.1 DUF2336 domain-containing protein [Bradyrhizobium sp. 84]MCK1318002.1 DUF2336 domain-containing protein [Bradyrhizobium sp. 23]MCK1324338.1 DUF2336 domain-containing protein [Bradyrhizobium sp. 156]MCK1330956.1 DUF2336 domain-containing protein [Bradyrhizobium sp. CW9]
MRSKSAKSSENLLEELQTALSHGTVAHRVETLRRVTDLFVGNASDYSDDHVRVFDDVFQCLIEQIETSAKALLADRLAPIAAAPPKIIRTLALDEVIEVSGPVLSKSERLDEEILIEIARTRGQAHLKAISLRRVLSEALTDVLVTRGDEDVVQSTVSNPGAQLSEGSLADLVTRAERDDDLASCIGLRPDLPRHHYLKLVAKASLAVRRKLEAAHPEFADDVSSVVQEAAQRIRAASMTRQTERARALVKSLHEDGRLTELQVATFAEQGKFDETNAGLAALAGVAVETAETMMIESRIEGVMILAKVAAMQWSSVRAIIALREKLSGGSQTDMLTLRDAYEALRSSTAQQVLRFHRMQQGATPAA